MEFFDGFNIIRGDEITLKLAEKYPGDEDGVLPFYYYDIFESSTGDFAGKISLRIGDNRHSYYNGHIGYEIEPEKRGRGYAGKACRLVLPVARAHGMTRLYLTCKESNAASRKTIEKLGGIYIETAKIPEWCFFYKKGIEDYRIYKLLL